MTRMHDDEVHTDAALVAGLVAAQFPEWASLRVEPVASTGTDNAMYRLGDDLSVRMPRIHWAVDPLLREFEWLPRIAPALPFAAPVPAALGVPGDGFPWPWTVCRWIDGVHPVAGAVEHAERLAADLAGFVVAMRGLDRAGAPTTAWPRPLHEEDELVRANLAALEEPLRSIRDDVVAVWEDALAAAPATARTWIHGDLSPGNLLLRGGELVGVLDFSAMGLGDPASDLRVAWNLLPAPARAVFRRGVGADDATWARARGWVLLQALAQLPYYASRNPPLADNARHVIAELVAERHDGMEMPRPR
ncbi:aminoglycoside phosphotransferase (APT) family kinase protein [Agromyces ramosus]|uniref:Aminoglycoside phosphotransferase (APT) family kinase protein n=1 Tax=Agromyces ramosus TaxID=33879 RepID=A0A4V2F024_9MICO|nr:aminoglycoside phosphotransferase family protein [Agromyces ramosus]RZS68500.1 aminoglycoside phosphotransferase (APT) family kinase protein [Agromyces ramosus]